MTKVYHNVAQQIKELLNMSGKTKGEENKAGTFAQGPTPQTSENSVHYVADRGKAHVILDVLVTRADLIENLPMLELLFRSRFPLAPAPTLGYRGCHLYGTTENIAAIEKAGILAYTALVDHEKRPSLFGRDAFTYDAEKDLYTCPRGEVLRRRGYDHRERSVRYAAIPSACNARSLQARCTCRAQRGVGSGAASRRST